MAKLPMYRDRGLTIPHEFLARTIEPDLCEHCAIGKPTLTHTSTTHSRSLIKGRLWYFDVSGGGELSPSLVNGNKYCCMFADSCTRMYFDFYTKDVKDKAILKILHLFSEQVLIPLQREVDEFTFLRSDQGQLNTKGVRAYCRRGSIINQYTYPYHPEMNGFVERSFRSTKELARCMMNAAGLPYP